LSVISPAACLTLPASSLPLPDTLSLVLPIGVSPYLVAP
jgi:hypothetical protein